MENYRKAYEKYVCKIPKGFIVHHLDENRKNNEISNLLMLPKTLHLKYHENKMNFLVYQTAVSSIAINTEILSVTEKGNKHNDLLIETILEFEKTRKECCKWKDYRDYCLGLIPNIHNIVLEAK